MTDTTPDDIRELAEARSVAREAHDWAEADRLRAEIEAAGWKVVDRGTRFKLSPAVPSDVIDDDRVRYGSSATVPSRLDHAATHDATVIVRVTDEPGDVGQLLDGLRRVVPPRTQVVIVADAPDHELAGWLHSAEGPASGPVGDEPAEILWTAHRLGPAGAANAALRRAAGAVVILLDPDVVPTGDLVTPLTRTLDDPSVAVAGAWGTVSSDLRRWVDAPVGDVDAVDAAAMAFRRTDYVARGPLDEGFRTPDHLATWWSLILRDEGAERPPRRAVRPPDVPLLRRELADDRAPPSADVARKAKRDFYRLLDRFGRRRDLLVGERPA